MPLRFLRISTCQPLNPLASCEISPPRMIPTPRWRASRTRSLSQSFAAASLSPDPKIHDAAATALRNVRAAEQPLFLDVYGSPYYDSRFSNNLAYLEAQGAGHNEASWGARVGDVLKFLFPPV